MESPAGPRRTIRPASGRSRPRATRENNWVYPPTPPLSGISHLHVRRQLTKLLFSIISDVRAVDAVLACDSPFNGRYAAQECRRRTDATNRRVNRPFSRSGRKPTDRRRCRLLHERQRNGRRKKSANTASRPVLCLEGTTHFQRHFGQASSRWSGGANNSRNIILGAFADLAIANY